MAELQGTTAKSTYVYGMGLVCGTISGYSGKTYFIQNGHGDVLQLQNSSRTVVKEYVYDAYGNEKNPVATDANPFRYAGQYYDKETGTYDLRARYYDPVIGRFTQEDPHWNVGNMIYGDDPLKLNNYNYSPSLVAIIQSGNLYVYAMSNPVMYVNENGGQMAAIFLILKRWALRPFTHRTFGLK